MPLPDRAVAGPQLRVVRRRNGCVSGARHPLVNGWLRVEPRPWAWTLRGAASLYQSRYRGRGPARAVDRIT